MSLAIRTHLSTHSAYVPTKGLLPLTNARTDSERAAWLHEIHWKLVARLPFPAPIYLRTAEDTFHRYVDEMESRLHTRIGVLYGKEVLATYRTGKVDVLFRMCITSLAKLHSEELVAAWMDVSAPSRSDVLASVQKYRGADRAVETILNMTSAPKGEWGVHDLQYFHPSTSASPVQRCMSSRHRRHARRWTAKMVESAPHGEVFVQDPEPKSAFVPTWPEWNTTPAFVEPVGDMTQW